MKILYYMPALLTCCICACQRIDVVEPESDEARIKMWASVPSAAALEAKSQPVTQSGMSADNAFYYYEPEEVETRALPTDNLITSITDATYDIGMLRIDDGYHSLYPRFAYQDPTNTPSEPLLAQLGKPDAENSYLREISFTSAAQFFRNSNAELKFAAWYPWKNDDAAYNFTTGRESTSVTIPIDGSTDILYGSVATGSQANGFNVMDFNHALCLYRIYAYAMYIEEDGKEINTAETWGEIEELSFQKVSKHLTLTLPCAQLGDKEYDQYKIEYAAGENNLQTLVLNDPANKIYFESGGQLPFGIANRRLVAVCLAPPPEEGVLNINVKTYHADALQRVSIARNFQAGHAYDVVLRFSAHGIINSAVSVGEWQEYPEDLTTGTSTIFYNLSRYGTSNCYEISSGNYNYCFDGTVMGNGNGESVGISDPSLDTEYVDILWSDIPDNLQFKDKDGNLHSKPLIELVSNRLSQGKVLLHVNGDYTDDETTNTALKAEGNVIIAAYDRIPEYASETDKTVTNGARIIWTWHLWITDAVDDVGNNNGIIIQDRNLGAISSNPETEGVRDYDMYGLSYQWGRPTPFNLKNYSTANGTQLPAEGITIPNSSMTAGHTSVKAASVQEAISNPMTLYGIGPEVDWVVKDENFINLWGWSNNYSDADKTLYDPCPYGYRVPGYRMWAATSSFQKSYNSETGAIMDFGGSHADEYYYLPAVGYFTSDGKYKDNDTFFIWSMAHVGGEGENKDYIYALHYNGSDHAHLHESTSSTEPTQIRCISRRVRSVVTDLSASQTANCYMINGPGYYKFKATTRGNGLGSLLPIGGSTTVEINYGVTPTINPAEIASIKPLWWQGDMSSPNFEADKGDPDTNLSLISLSDYKIDKDGYFAFYVNELKEGNLILAAYDPDGVILWTWHLWFTDKPKEKRSGNYALMDRFLGATYVPEISGGTVRFDGDDATAEEWTRLSTYGFYYQWGRKDPIVGAPGTDAGDETGSGTTSGSSPYWVYDLANDKWEDSPRTAIEVDGTRPGVAAVVRDPMKFYHGSATNGNGGNWINPSQIDGRTNPAMWGYAVEGYDTGQSYSKTMWDPCPPGYRTPLHHVWYYSDSYRYASAEGATSYTYGGNEQKYDSAGLGIVTGKQDANIVYFEEIWYPYAGYRNPSSGRYTDVGENGFMLSGMPMGQYNMRSFYWYKAGGYYGNDQNRTGQSCDQTGPSRGPAFGMPVRCQKE